MSAASSEDVVESLRDCDARRAGCCARGAAQTLPPGRLRGHTLN